MFNMRRVFRVLSITLTLSAAACQADETSAERTALASVVGDWQVTEVLTDQKDTDQGLEDKYVAPKYLGLIVTLTSDRFLINTHYDASCEKARLTRYRMKASDVIRKSISTRLFSPARPTPEDMQLPLVSDEPVDVLYLSCDGKFRSKDQGMAPAEDLSNVVWFISLGNEKLAMSWHEQTVLILSRLTKNTQAAASFDCARAETAAEKAICSSVGLAAYDKSVSQAYRLARNYYRSQNDSAAAGELSYSQKAWLNQRNDCGDDAKCLEKEMSNRVGDILYDLGDYMYQHR